MSKKKKHQKHEEEEGGEAWLLPYSDLMTLLLAVFIVLFAVSQVDQAKSAALAQSFSESMIAGGAGIFSGTGTAVIPGSPDGSGTGADTSTGADNSTGTDTGADNSTGTDTGADNSTGDNSTAEPTDAELQAYFGSAEFKNLVDWKAEIDSKLSEEEIASSITTDIDMRGLVISLNNAILFDSGQAEIQKENEGALLEVASLIKTISNYVRVEGHTDSLPMSSAKYPSNWELSTARASSVVRLFIEKGGVSAERLLAAGYGEYRPVADNMTAEGRAKNRRIDIIILSEKYDNLED